MKILHLISSGGMYGAEAMLLNLAAAQRRAGCEPVIGAFDNHRAPHVELVQRAARLGLAVEMISCRGRLDTQTPEAIRRVAARIGADLLHSHGYKANLYGFRAARSMDLPLVITCHLWTGSTASVRVYEFLDAQVMRRAAKVVAVSDPIAATLERAGIRRENLQTIYNGVDLSPFAGARPSLRRELNCDGRPLIGLVGRLEQQKGIEYFIQAAAQVRNEWPDALFVVVGEGSQRARLEALIRDSALADCFLLLGERSDMPGVYASLDLFVLSSIDEGMPMTILEALASRRPVIASEVGSVGELVIHERTGLLVQPRDVRALSDAMLRCLRDPAFASDLGRRGEAHIREHFSADSMAGEYLQLYRSVCGVEAAPVPAPLQEA